MEAAEDFRCSGNALEFGDGHEVAKIAEFPLPNFNGESKWREFRSYRPKNGDKGRRTEGPERRGW
jgi:hypothetical protein